MRTGRSASAVVVGVQAHVVEVEAHVASGLPAWHIVGLPDAAVNESRDRIRAAAASSGLTWPTGRITVGLGPASLPKRGSGLDLSIAVAVLGTAANPAPVIDFSRWMFVGELALDGAVRPVGSVLPAAIAAIREGLGRLVIPGMNSEEASLVPGLDILPVWSLRQLWAHVMGQVDEAEAEADKRQSDQRRPEPVAASAPAPDLAEVRGQEEARHALVVAAAGGHHLCLAGPAGVGKTLLAQRLPGLLPDLHDADALEVTAIRALTDTTGATGLVRRPPFCSPHHSASDVALVGGGTADRPRIGLVTKAHAGVLFLDEAAEFSAAVLDSLRQAMEERSVTVARSGLHVQLPARFQLVMATNPCPCGRALDTTGPPCTCSSVQRRRYLAKLEGPLMDRVDVRLTLRRPTIAEMAAGGGESTAVAGQRVLAARDRAARRLADTPWHTNGEVPARVIRSEWPVPGTMQEALDAAAATRESIRGLDLSLRVAWTLADLAGRDVPSSDDLHEAMLLRQPEGWWS